MAKQENSVATDAPEIAPNSAGTVKITETSRITGGKVLTLQNGVQITFNKFFSPPESNEVIFYIGSYESGRVPISILPEAFFKK